MSGVVAYLTDVEGMWDRFAGFLHENPHVRLEGDTLQLAAGATFVFGGDAIDRGPAGRRIVRLLVDAKRRHPDRVVLLAGNRDINKLRLWRELTGHPPVRAPADVASGPRPALLRWIFENTMGAKGAFEFRRTELGGERSVDIGDEQVVDSYLADLAADGDLRAYLTLAQLAWRSDNTLYVHGGLTEESLGAIPGAPRVANVDDWTARLNAWYRDQLDAFAAERHDAAGAPAWQPLIAYQAPTPGLRVNMSSVVYGRTADDLNNPRLPPRPVVAALQAAGIDRVIVGHTPNGDSPSILRDGRFQMIIADNSYARVQTGAKLFVRPESLQIFGATVLDDGRAIDLSMDLPLDDPSDPIGLRTADTGHLIKARHGSEHLLFRYLPGFKAEQLLVDVTGRPLVAPY